MELGNVNQPGQQGVLERKCSGTALAGHGRPTHCLLYTSTCIEVEDRSFEGSHEEVIDSLVLSQRYLRQFVV